MREPELAEEQDVELTFCLTQIVFEDDKVIAFLDKFPVVPGHTLVVPKEQTVKVHEMRWTVAISSWFAPDFARDLFD